MDDKDYLTGELRSLWSVVFVAMLCFAATRGRIGAGNTWKTSYKWRKNFRKSPGWKFMGYFVP